MDLVWLMLNNFRQFEGRTLRLEFARPGERNVTVIHGSNGAGKTTLLNALTWALYGTFTDAFASPEQLINRNVIRAASPGARIECSVEMMFEHNDRRYWLERTRAVNKNNGGGIDAIGPDEIAMKSAGPEGEWGPAFRRGEVDDIIGRILPEQLHRYFFFDGERIEQLQRPDKRAQVVSSTAMLIGELVFTRAIEHLDQARRRLESELKGLGDAQTNDVLEQKEDRELRRERLVALRSQQAANYDGFVKQKQAIQDELRQLHTVSELQRQRDLLTDHEAGLHTQLARNRTVLADIVATSGYKTFLPGAVATFRSVIGDLRTSGELPSAIKTQFVERLLDEHECICGRPLIPGDPHYELVKRWMDRGGMSDVEEAAMRMEGQFSGNDREIGELFERIDGEQEQRSTGKRTLSTVEAELDQIREKLRGSPEDNVRDLQLKLEEVDHSILAVMRDQEADKLQIDALDREINALEQEMLKRQSKSDQLELTRRRLAACREAKQVLDEVRQRRRTYYRQDLADRINRIFSEMSFTPYSARLGEDYSLTLTDGPNGGPVGASTGESQILSLSFIGAVIEQARDLAARRDNLPGPESSTYPLVMDSPFGNLDSVYRRQVATHMPILASQVVVLVSKTQWVGEVETALGPRIGKEYVLTYHSPKADAEEESIARHDRHYDLVKRSSLEFDATELVEVLR